MLLAEALGHAFGAVRALDNVSFTLQPGQTLAVFGPNGAGKTTLLKVLAGLIRPRTGRAQIEGGRRAVGWIAHQPQLYGQLTVSENLRFWSALYDVPEPAARQRASDLVSRLGLQAYEHRLVRELSRGLDRAAAEEFRRLLAEQAAEGRVTVLVTHNVEEGTELATDVAFMHGGRFVQLAPRSGRGAAEIADAYRRAVTGG